MSKPILTQARLRELFDYDPETGVFVWRVRPNGRVPAGSIAHHIDNAGYNRIGLDRRLHAAHRLAWVYMTGSHPLGQIDHINGIRHDNRWVNLRDVSKTRNIQNQRVAHSQNNTGYLGVSPKNNKWQASIRVLNKQHYLGVFATPALAHQAYVEAKRIFHPTCSI